MSPAPRKPGTKSRNRFVPKDRDLSSGVIVVLSGGFEDIMNPPEVRSRMNEFITAVNHDPYVQTNTGGKGLRFHLLPNQKEKYLHKDEMRKVCDALIPLKAQPLIVVGHSFGGSAAMNLARCVKKQGKTVDLLFTADSVGTVDDIADPHAVNKVPANVGLNINSYVIPTLAYFLLPFPIGRTNVRAADNSFDNLLNIGLRYDKPGVIGHRNAFYHLAGGDRTLGGTFEFPSVLLETTIAVLQGVPNDSILSGTVKPLQKLATGADTEIRLATAKFKQTLRP